MKNMDTAENVRYLGPHQIQTTDNVRTTSSKEAQADLAESIKRLGILQPLLCTTRDGKKGGFVLVAGYRRFQAAKALGLGSIPVIIRPGMSEDDIVNCQLEENIKREDLNPIDEGRFLSEYRKKKPDKTFEELAQRIGKTAKYVAQRIALVDRLIPAFQEMVQKGELSLSKAHVLAAISEEDQDQFSPKGKGLDRWGREYNKDRLEGNSTEDLAERISEKLRAVQGRLWKKVEPLKKGEGQLPDCDKCMKRSDRQGYLLGVVDSKKAMCLDSSCWREHVALFYEMELERRRKKGRRILTAAEVKIVNCSDHEGTIRDFGLVGSTTYVPYRLEDSGKYKARCLSCPDMAFYIKTGRNLDGGGIAKTCCNITCLNEKAGRKATKLSATEKKSNADRATAYSDQVVEGSARVFAAAAWALARARSVKTEGPDLKALPRVLHAINRRISGDSIAGWGAGWILDKCGCAVKQEYDYVAAAFTNYFEIAPIDTLEKLPPRQLDEAIRALSYLEVMEYRLPHGNLVSSSWTGTMTNCHVITGDMSALNAQARKLFSPSDEAFLQSMVKCGIQAVGRFHKIKGMGGKRKAVVEKLMAAELTSKEKMYPALDKMFDKGLWKKLSAKPKPKAKKKTTKKK